MGMGKRLAELIEQKGRYYQLYTGNAAEKAG